MILVGVTLIYVSGCPLCWMMYSNLVNSSVISSDDVLEVNVCYSYLPGVVALVDWDYSS